MEMLELNAANQNAVNGNGAYINQQILAGSNHQTHQQHPQQMNISPTHMYRGPAQHNLKYVNNHKASKHRELPVDVPDSFIGVAKQSPRYPPPKQHRQVSPPMPLNNVTAFNHNPQIIPFNTNSQRPTMPPLSPNTAANIAHNNSLRSSIKLKQLEKSRGGQYGGYPVGQMQPAINQAFELNEDEPTPSTIQHSNADSQRQVPKPRQPVPDLYSIYNRLQPDLNGEFSAAAGDAKFPKILSIYNTLAHTRNKEFRVPNLISKQATTVDENGLQEPVVYRVSDLIQSVASMIAQSEQLTEEAAALVHILYKHEMEGVCSAFDRITQSFEFATLSRPPTPQGSEMVLDNRNGMYQRHSPEYSHDQNIRSQYGNHQLNRYDCRSDQVQMDVENNFYPGAMHPLTDIDLDDGSCTKIVHIERGSSRPLGATIKNEEDGSVIIGRIVCGGDAARSGLLHEGDEILEINGIPMRGKNINEVVRILERMDGTLTFKLNVRNLNKPTHQSRHLQGKFLVKTFFNYEADRDDFMPVKELGLSFREGEILEIIDVSDPKWWQARREGDDEHRLAGLIPSANFLKHIQDHQNQENSTASYFKNEKKNLVSLLFNCPKGSMPRSRKRPLDMPFSSNEIPPYEEVCLYYPTKSSKRPIFLIGIRHIGQREIIDKFVQSDPNRFAAPITHTSRQPLAHERNGVDFYFVSKAQFEQDMKLRKLIEYGLHQNHWYGTSIEVIKEIVRAKKVSI